MTCSMLGLCNYLNDMYVRCVLGIYVFYFYPRINVFIFALFIDLH